MCGPLDGPIINCIQVFTEIDRSDQIDRALDRAAVREFVVQYLRKGVVEVMEHFLPSLVLRRTTEAMSMILKRLPANEQQELVWVL